MSDKDRDIKIRIQRLSHYEGLSLPAYQTDGASGMDLLAAVEEKGIVIEVGSFVLVPTGIIIELPDGYEAQVRPRSGLAVKHGIGILNSPGTIDSDYRGEIKVALINFGQEAFLVQRGMRIAQMVIAPVIRAQLVDAASLNETSRSDGGFGHTGL